MLHAEKLEVWQKVHAVPIDVHFVELRHVRTLVKEQSFLLTFLDLEPESGTNLFALMDPADLRLGVLAVVTGAPRPCEMTQGGLLPERRRRTPVVKTNTGYRLESADRIYL